MTIFNKKNRYPEVLYKNNDIQKREILQNINIFFKLVRSYIYCDNLCLTLSSRAKREDSYRNINMYQYLSDNNPSFGVLPSFYLLLAVVSGQIETHLHLSEDNWLLRCSANCVGQVSRNYLGLQRQLVVFFARRRPLALDTGCANTHRQRNNIRITFVISRY